MAYVHDDDCDGVIELRVNPFMEDVHGEIVWEEMCECYYHMLCMEI